VRATAGSTTVAPGSGRQAFRPVKRLPATGTQLETVLTGAVLTTGTGGLLLLLSWGLGRRRQVARRDVAG
jgi:hypothetical protein